MGIRIEGVVFDEMTEEQVVDRVMSQLDEGLGGQILTPNVDILRQLRRSSSSELQDRAEIIVADGMPIVWVSRILGRRLPARVTGSSLVWSLSNAAAARGRSVFLLGGAPGVAVAAARELQQRFPDLRVVGVHSPPVGFELQPDLLADVRARLIKAQPAVVFVALGHPKQDFLAASLKNELPTTWFLGCGGALTMAASRTPRAPCWMQTAGLEWLQRLALEPKRLFRRYVLHDAPFAVVMLARALVSRLVWSVTHREPGAMTGR